MKFPKRTIAAQLWVLFGLSVTLMFLGLLSRHSRLGASATAWARPFTQTDMAVFAEHVIASFALPCAIWVVFALQMTGTFKPTAMKWAQRPQNRALVMMISGVVVAMVYQLYQVGHEYAQLMLMKPSASFYFKVSKCMPSEKVEQLAACVSRFDYVQTMQNVADFCGITAFLLIAVVLSMSWLQQAQRDGQK